MLRRNVLIFHAGALGDFVLSWPLAVALGRIYAQSRVIYVTHGQKGRLAQRVLRLESMDIETGWHSLFADAAQLPEPQLAALQSAHLIISFIGDTQQWKQNVAALNPAARIISLTTRPEADYHAHASQWMVDQLAPHPIEQQATIQLLRSVESRGIGYRRTGGEEIILHPGSGSPDKCWPGFVELIERLAADGHRLKVVLGEAEQECFSSRQISELFRGTTVRHPGTLLEFLDELNSARAFIGNDSGPGHLAGIIGTPTLSLFGPTDPAVWRPLGPCVKTRRSQQLFDLLVADVVPAIVSLLSS